MNEILNGIMLGLGVCIPFGPINILIISLATRSFKNAYALGLGASTGDFIYLFLLYFGLLEFIKDDTFLDGLSVFGFVFLTYMSWQMFKSGVKTLEVNEKPFKDNIFINYFKGMAINMSNPYVIMFWLSAATILSTTKEPMFLFSGLFVSIFGWIFSLSFFVYKYTKFFTPKILRGINIFSALILEYFAIMLILRRFFGF